MLFALMLGLASPVPAPPPIRIWDVPELTDAQMRELDGKIIFVRGWVSGCDHGLRRGSSCSISDRRSDPEHSMNLGGREPAFRELRVAAGHEAVLRVRVLADCHHPETSFCLENSTDLVTLNVVRIIPAKRS